MRLGALPLIMMLLTREALGEIPVMWDLRPSIAITDVKRIYFLRHGESLWNKRKSSMSDVVRSLGRDVELSTRGIEQAYILASWFEGAMETSKCDAMR